MSSRTSTSVKNSFSGGTIAAILGAVVLLGFLAFLIYDRTTAITVQQVPEPTVHAEANVEVTETSVIVGDPNADDHFLIYADFLCPFCAELELQTADAVSQAIDDGEITAEWVFVDFLGVRSTNSFSGRAANLMAYVADTSPEHFLDMQVALYENQPNARGEDGPSDEDLIQLAREVGVEIDEEGEERITGLAYGDWIAENTRHATAQDVGGIPTVLLNDEVLPEAADPQIFLSYLEDVVE